MTSFFERIGHGLKIAAKDSAKVAMPVAAVVLPLVIPPPAEHIASAVLGLVTKKVDANSETGVENDMSPLEIFAITMVLGLVQSTVKNPTHAAQMRAQLLGVADNIYMAYGLTPPMPAAATTAAPVPPAQG